MTIDKPQKRRHWLLTSPRTASNMLVRILNLNAQGVRPAKNGGYFFFPNVLARMDLYTKPASEWTAQEHAAISALARDCFVDLQNHIEAAERSGEGVFVKEHVSFLTSVYSETEYLCGGRGCAEVDRVTPMRGLNYATRSELNITCLPDEFLKTWHPTFLIRHPAMMFPSLYRAFQKSVALGSQKRHLPEPQEAETTLRFVRSLYEFYAEYFGRDSLWPVVLDADDVMTSPEVVVKYARLVGLDVEKLRFEWDLASEEELSGLPVSERIMLSSILASRGVDRGKVAGDVDVDAEAVKWREEFGERGGRNLERWVRGALPDYEYLRSRRLRV